MLRWQMSGGQDLPAWYRAPQAPVVSSWPSVSSYNFRPVPYDVLKRQHEVDLERMLQAAERMPEDADPERVGLFDEMAAAMPFPQRQPPGQRAEYPALPAAMRAAEPASAEPLADAAASGAAPARLHAGQYTAAQWKHLAALSRTIQDAEREGVLYWPATEAASREAAMILMRDDAAGLRSAIPELPVVPNCMAFYRMYACGADRRPALTRLDELTGSTAWRSGGNKPGRWRKMERFAAIIEEGLPRNDDGKVNAEDALAAAARIDGLRGQMRLPTFINHIFHERAAANKAARAAGAAVAAGAAAAATANEGAAA